MNLTYTKAYCIWAIILNNSLDSFVGWEPEILHLVSLLKEVGQDD